VCHVELSQVTCAGFLTKVSCASDFRKKVSDVSGALGLQNTHMNWFTSKKVEVVIFAKQVDILMICLEPFSTHYEVVAEILAYSNSTHLQIPSVSTSMAE